MRMIVLVFVALGSFSQAALAQDPPAVGMILEVPGQTQIERAGSSSPGQLASLLYLGDTLVVDSGSVSFIFCPSEQRISLESGAVAELGPEAISVTGPEASRRDMDCTLPRVALGAENFERIGALQPRTIYDPIPLYTGGRISSNRPVFRWKDVDGVDSYELRLTDEEDLGLWTYRTDDNSAPYPESMLPLADGMYTWQLSAENQGEILFQERADFVVEQLSQDFAESLEEFGNSFLEVFGLAETEPSETAGATLIEAIQLENEGYYTEAAELYTQLRGDDTDPRITRHLAWLYLEAELVAAAADELSRLQ